MGRLATLEIVAMPSNALLRARLKQKIARERKLIRDLEELLAETPTAKAAGVT